MPLFALQLLRTGKLTDFTVANDHFRAIMADASLEFGPREAKYGPVRAAVCDEIRKLAGRR